MKKFGIEIVKPWSQEMYEHNDKVATLMKIELKSQIKKTKDPNKLNQYLVLCGGVKYYKPETYDVKALQEACLDELKSVPNFWLAQEWNFAVADGLVRDVKLSFIGY